MSACMCLFMWEGCVWWCSFPSFSFPKALGASVVSKLTICWSSSTMGSQKYTGGHVCRWGQDRRIIWCLSGGSVGLAMALSGPTSCEYHTLVDFAVVFIRLCMHHFVITVEGRVGISAHPADAIQTWSWPRSILRSSVIRGRMWTSGLGSLQCLY